MSTTPHDDQSQTPATPPRLPTNEEYAAKFMKQSIQKVAARLRRIADDVERLASDVDKVPAAGYASYGNVAAEVVSTVRNGLMNVHMEQVVTYASQADIARVEDAQGGESR